MSKIVSSCLISFLLTGCLVNTHNPEASVFKKTETELVEEGQKYISRKSYKKAIASLQEFEVLYPLSIQSPLVQKLLIEAYYADKQLPMLKASCERFMFEHPRDERIDQVKYLHLQSMLLVADGYPFEWMPLDRSKRDMSLYKEVLFYAENFIQECPNSRYKQAVETDKGRVQNMIARSYWLSMKDFISRDQKLSALRLGNEIIRQYPNYPDLPHVKKALHKLEESIPTIDTITCHNT